MYDYENGLDLASLHVAANFAIDGAKAGTSLATKFKQTAPGVWEMRLSKPLITLDKGQLTVSVKDKQGNMTQTDRTFSVSLLPPAGALFGGSGRQP